MKKLDYSKVSPILMDSVDETVKFAVNCHALQWRKGSGLPYIVHPMAVLSMVGTQWKISDRDVWKAAICHDIYEDCPNVNKQELLEIIGSKAESIVRELTFVVDGQSGLSKQEQKQQYMDLFQDKSIESFIIKLADRCCNTFDFLADRNTRGYAGKYWGKALELHSSLYKRSDEIIEKYGSQTFSSIVNTQDLVTIALKGYDEN